MKCLCANTRRAARSVTRLYEDELRPAGLTAAQFELLSELAHRPPMAQAELAGHLGLDQTTLSRNLRGMVEREWVVRSVGAEDKRQSVYAVTSAGRVVWEAAVPHWERAQAHMRGRLGKDWKKVLAMLGEIQTAASV